MALMQVLSVLSTFPPGFRLVVAHLDHGLRGARGEADARFVRRAAGRLGLPVRLGHARLTARGGHATEAMAREARYRFLRRVATSSRASRIALGHTADDQAETVLHRLCRGCGIRGAAAMAPVRRLDATSRVRIVRPFLSVGRRDLLAYLRAKRVTYRTDETNNSDGWTRNRIRHRILPRLSREIHAGASESLARFAAQAAAAHRLIVECATAAARQLPLRMRRGACVVPLRRMARLPDAVRGELWCRILDRLDAGIATAYREVEGLESLLGRGGASSLSLRGGRLLARRSGDEVRVVARNVP
jgi:tRNA(Ile)-lysidine synthase